MSFVLGVKRVGARKMFTRGAAIDSPLMQHSHYRSFRVPSDEASGMGPANHSRRSKVKKRSIMKLDLTHSKGNLQYLMKPLLI